MNTLMVEQTIDNILKEKMLQDLETELKYHELKIRQIKAKMYQVKRSTKND